MLIMASVIRVGQSKFVTVPIDEDSTERIMNCIQTLSELESKPPVHEIFLKDTKAAYSKMVAAQEVCGFCYEIILMVDGPWTCRKRQPKRRSRRRRRPLSSRSMTS